METKSEVNVFVDGLCKLHALIHAIASSLYKDMTIFMHDDSFIDTRREQSYAYQHGMVFPIICCNVMDVDWESTPIQLNILYNNFDYSMFNKDDS